jgi:hypothetical protein
MKIFHLNNMTTQRTPRANAGKVLVTAVSIENKIIGGKSQTDSSPLKDHPMYRMLEAYVLANPSVPSLENPPFAPALPPSPAARTPVTPKPPVAGDAPSERAPNPPAPPARRFLRPVDKTVPRGKK